MSPLHVMSLLLRIVAIGLVVVSPWLQPRKVPSSARSVVFVVDRSGSMGTDGLIEANEYIANAWAHRHDGVQFGAVAFDGRAELVARVGQPGPPVLREGTQPSSSDLASGIRLAMAALPAEGHRSIVLLTDARPTRGDAGLEAQRAAEKGIRIDVVPIGGPAPPLPLVTAVKPRATHVAERQPVALDVDVRHDGPFVLRWTRDGVALPSRTEYVRPNGTTADVSTIELLDPTPPPGVHVYEVKATVWAGCGSTPGASEHADSPVIAAVSVEGKAYAAVFSSTGDVPRVLRAALEESGLEVRPLPLERAADPASYSGADLVVLADVRVSAAAKDDGALTRGAQTSLVEYVQQGGGLLVTGGVFGLAPEYAGTPIARVIPVEIEDRGHVEDPPVALAIMLDRSGSMAAPVGGHTKIELAIEASLGAADVLRSSDQVGIASVDTETHWNVPLGPQDRLAQLRPEVRQVTAGGGGIYVFTALKDAYAALATATTPIRHVILFSDTSDSEEQSESCAYAYAGCDGTKTAEALAKEARAKGITTTVVGIGEEEAQDTAFLRRLAAAAGGRFYLTTEGTDLRRIFLSETRVLAQSNLREKKTAVSAAAPHPALEGLDPSKLPELSAYVETGRRSGADTALLLADGSRPEGRPMLATWRYGLGKAGALTTDLVEGWGDAWASSQEAAKLLRQTLRFLLRESDAHRADAMVRMKDRVVEVDLELPPDAPDDAAPKSIDVFAIEQGGTSRKLDVHLEPRGPGRWIARGRSNGEPIIIARARDGRGALMAEAVGREDHASELAGDGVDEHLASELANIGGGRVRPAASDLLSRTLRPAPELAASWPFALIAAAALVVLDLVFRRLGGPKRPRRTAVLLHHAGADLPVPPAVRPAA